jgi:polyisoprenyl-phosphate glycosyltransferase
MVRFAFDAIFSFSVIPLRVATVTGCLVMLISIFLAARTLYMRLVLNSIIPGFTALFVVVLTLGGLNLLILGIVGEYLGRVYVEVKGRPLYLVDQVYSADSKKVAQPNLV